MGRGASFFPGGFSFSLASSRPFFPRTAFLRLSDRKLPAAFLPRFVAPGHFQLTLGRVRICGGKKGAHHSSNDLSRFSVLLQFYGYARVGGD